MGYKRMKKRKLMIGGKLMYRMWFGGCERVDIDYRVYEMGWDKMPPPSKDTVSFIDRIKKFEYDPNAEGYLDM